MKKLEAELRRHANSDIYPFHMPGHKGRGDEIHRIDITEIDGFDNLHDPEDLILGEMQAAQAYYGTEQTYFSVNGSTCALLAAISAAIPKKGTLLCERGCHISVYHAAYLRELNLAYIEESVTIHEKTGRFLLKEDLNIDGIIITSPSYEGVVKNIPGWAALAREKDVPLIVDEAHGAHFSMHSYFPVSAVREGADLVVQSLHKTLPAMTQTALLHNVTGNVSDALIKRFLDIYETSSPSYVLMASITNCLHQVMDENQDLLARYAHQLKYIRKELAGLSHLHLLGGETGEILSDEEFPPYRKGQKIDPGKICIFTDRTTISGPELYDRLRIEYHLQPEMKAPDYVILMTSPYDTQEGYDRLIEALTEIEAELKESEKKLHSDVQRVIPDSVYTIAEAMELSQEEVPLEMAKGRIAGEYVIVYPPDAPVIVPGEMYSEEIIENIRSLRKSGLTLTGITGDQVQVLPFPEE